MSYTFAIELSKKKKKTSLSKHTNSDENQGKFIVTLAVSINFSEQIFKMQNNKTLIAPFISQKSEMDAPIFVVSI